MKISYVLTDCRDKISAACTKTFERKIQRGRPAVNCEACREVTKFTVSTETHRNCVDCGNRFELRIGGKGRKAIRCNTCRTPVKIVRTDTERIASVQAETLAEETREIRETRGSDRAAMLVMMMRPLIAKREKVSA
jgi:hypothetical protein